MRFFIIIMYVCVCVIIILIILLDIFLQYCELGFDVMFSWCKFKISLVSEIVSNIVSVINID